MLRWFVDAFSFIVLRLGRHQMWITHQQMIISSFLFETFDRSTNGMSRGRMAIFQDLCNRHFWQMDVSKLPIFLLEANLSWFLLKTPMDYRKIPLKCSIIFSLLTNKSWYLVVFVIFVWKIFVLFAYTLVLDWDLTWQLYHFTILHCAFVIWSFVWLLVTFLTISFCFLIYFLILSFFW